MKRYITWSEYLKIHPRDTRYNCDEHSKNIIQEFVEKQCNCVCTYFSTPDVDCSLDFRMFSKSTGKCFLCEIKDRWSFISTAYSDHIIEQKKLKGLVARAQRGEGSGISLFSIYADGVIKVTANIIKNFIKYQNYVAPSTTTLDNHDPENKTFVLIKPDIIIYFCMLEDTDPMGNKTYTPYFQQWTPIDVNALNADLASSYQLF